MITFSLPSPEAVRKYCLAQSRLGFTYPEQHATSLPQKVNGYDNDYTEMPIGSGQADFDAARRLIQEWRMFPSEWTVILPAHAPIEPGQTVAMYARAFGLWWRNACRIVYVVNEPNRYGFAYGTLPGHIERGEELFLLEKRKDGTVYYSVKAFSTPRHWVARLAYPLMRRFQSRFRRDSCLQVKKRTQGV